jgi:hypothetical protein
MKKILLIGVPSDRVLSSFASFLKKHNYDMFFINLNLLADEVFFGEDCLLLHDKKIYYSDISGIYNRLVSIDPNVSHTDARMYYQQLELLNYLLDHVFDNVINTPSSASSNNSKPYQLSRAEKLGFNSPASIVLANVSCPDFENPTIYKSVGGIRSIVTEIINSDVNKEISCPVLFQEKIIGANIRAHLIDNDIYALKITSKEVDYRYTESPNKYLTIQLPEEIVFKCRELKNDLGLRFTGIDFMLTPDNEYYFLEANTSPAFTHFEEYMENKTLSAALAVALSGEN